MENRQVVLSLGHQGIPEIPGRGCEKSCLDHCPSLSGLKGKWEGAQRGEDPLQEQGERQWSRPGDLGHAGVWHWGWGAQRRVGQNCAPLGSPEGGRPDKIRVGLLCFPHLRPWD